MIGLAHPFHDSAGRPSWPARGQCAAQAIAAWRQAHAQGYELVRWRLSRGFARRLVAEEGSGPLIESLAVQLFGIPTEYDDAPDGFGMVVR